MSLPVTRNSRRAFAGFISLTIGTLLAAATSRADYLIGTPFENAVRRYSDDDGSTPISGGVAPFSGGLIFTSGVTVGPNGNIFASSFFTGEIKQYLPDGTFVNTFATLPLNPPHEPGGDPMLGSPGPLRFGPDGNLYVSDQSGYRVHKFNGTTGAYIEAAASDLSGPAGLAWDAEGTLYVGNFGNSTVVKIVNGASQPFIADDPETEEINESGGLLTPSSLLFLKSGQLLVSDLFGDQILKFNADGTFHSQFAQIDLDLGENPPEPRDNTDNPSDLGFDADGNIVVAVLGPTRPPAQTYGALLKYDLDGGEPIEEFILNETPFSSYAWIQSAGHVPGDYNNDGDVDSEDYDKWTSTYGNWIAKNSAADGSGNGVVGVTDYIVWRMAQESAGNGSNFVVPEPCTFVLLFAAAAFALPVRRR